MKHNNKRFYVNGQHTFGYNTPNNMQYKYTNNNQYNNNQFNGNYNNNHHKSHDKRNAFYAVLACLASILFAMLWVGLTLMNTKFIIIGAVSTAIIFGSVIYCLVVNIKKFK